LLIFIKFCWFILIYFFFLIFLENFGQNDWRSDCTSPRSNVRGQQWIYPALWLFWSILRGAYVPHLLFFISWALAPDVKRRPVPPSQATRIKDARYNIVHLEDDGGFVWSGQLYYIVLPCTSGVLPVVWELRVVFFYFV
jgi:hypothetical protein